MLPEEQAVPSPLRWIVTRHGLPYFQTEDGLPWHPIGQNDAISWHELNPLFRRRDVAAVESYLDRLARHGVTCMRLMLEYAQHRHRYFESPCGIWSPNLVRFWDDLFPLCERYGIRILLTPFDTFWMWLKFRHHPYSKPKGGPLDHPSRMLLCPRTRDAIKARLTFAAERWGGSGALFAWDLWNEIHPAQGEMSAEPFMEFIDDLSRHLRGVEEARFGRSHPQTVSLFGPELKLKPHMQMEHAIFRHPGLNFATLHIYETGTIDDPKNTVDPAIGMGRIVQQSLAEIQDQRPFFDSEHGPIHRFKDHHVTLSEPFDDEYFRHMQWAHLASGGAGGGMRWPNRHPHSLTAGMRLAQRSMARFLPEIDWLHFPRVNRTKEIRVIDKAGHSVPAKDIARFGCTSEDQALVYLLSRRTLTGGLLDRATPFRNLRICVPALVPGSYRIAAWDTVAGQMLSSSVQTLKDVPSIDLPPFSGDVAVAVRKLD